MGNFRLWIFDFSQALPDTLPDTLIKFIECQSPAIEAQAFPVSLVVKLITCDFLQDPETQFAIVDPLLLAPLVKSIRAIVPFVKFKRLLVNGVAFLVTVFLGCLSLMDQLIEFLSIKFKNNAGIPGITIICIQEDGLFVHLTIQYFEKRFSQKSYAHLQIVPAFLYAGIGPEILDQ
jgi:hypothetical protein